jgi:uncharacterized membrane protein
LRWGEAGAMAMAAGGVLYVLGMFVVTMIFNVPRESWQAKAPDFNRRLNYQPLGVA